ncbi:MAG: RNA 2',3'-cyclic phosphodiesterase [Nocardioidaceae bacterium]
MVARRLFVAVEVPVDVREYVVDRLRSWQRDLAGWRWSDPALWHLTLAFLGDVDESRRPELSERLSRAGRRRAPFEVGLAGLGAFSRPAKARVLWLGVGGDRDAMVRLAGSASAAARRVGISMEERSYRPHLTIGRRSAPVDVRDQLRAGPELRSPTWPVESFELVESHLGATVRHDRLEEFPLAGG